MWKRIKGLFSSGKSPSPARSATPGSSAAARLFGSSGKLKPQPLRDLANKSTLGDFLLFIDFPVLVGSSVHSGTLAPKKQLGAPSLVDPKHTQLFKADDVRKLVEGASLEHSIFPVRRGPSSENSDSSRFTIGRGAANDIVMQDFAVSETHAYIMIARHGYLLADLLSTNGTKLNGTPVGKVPMSLKDGDQLTFGRYDFTFKTPTGLYDFLTAKE